MAKTRFKNQWTRIFNSNEQPLDCKILGFVKEGDTYLYHVTLQSGADHYINPSDISEIMPIKLPDLVLVEAKVQGIKNRLKKRTVKRK